MEHRLLNPRSPGSDDTQHVSSPSVGLHPQHRTDRGVKSVAGLVKLEIKAKIKNTDGRCCRPTKSIAQPEIVSTQTGNVVIPIVLRLADRLG